MLLAFSVVNYFYVWNRYRIEKNKRVEQELIFSELSSFIFNDAVFQDSKGKSEKGYNVEEVSAKWDKFHDLTTKFYDARNHK